MRLEPLKPAPSAESAGFTPPATPWPLDPRQQAFLLHLMQDPTQSMQSIADAMQWSLRVLNLYLSTEEGLLLVAQCELATAVRTRIAAAAQLHNAIDALGMMLQEYAHSTRSTLMDDRKHTTHVLREQQRSNARRAAHLLFRLAHFNPNPIKSYTPAPQSPRLQPGHMQPATPIARPAPSATAPAPRACPTAEAVGSEVAIASASPVPLTVGPATVSASAHAAPSDTGVSPTDIDEEDPDHTDPYEDDDDLDDDAELTDTPPCITDEDAEASEAAEPQQTSATSIPISLPVLPTARMTGFDPPAQPREPHLNGNGHHHTDNTS